MRRIPAGGGCGGRKRPPYKKGWRDSLPVAGCGPHKCGPYMDLLRFTEGRGGSVDGRADVGDYGEVSF